VPLHAPGGVLRDLSCAVDRSDTGGGLLGFWLAAGLSDLLGNSLRALRVAGLADELTVTRGC
jgi:hypothetical protein